MTEINWCEEHGWNGWPDEDMCLWARERRNAGRTFSRCRMVQMRLTPADEVLSNPKPTIEGTR